MRNVVTMFLISWCCIFLWTSHISIRVYISKIADSTRSAGISNIAKCICNASIIFMEPPSNLRNIHDSNASLDITITYPFYLKYSQTVLQGLSQERTFSKNFRIFLPIRICSLYKNKHTFV